MMIYIVNWRVVLLYKREAGQCAVKKKRRKILLFAVAGREIFRMLQNIPVHARIRIKAH